MENIFIKYNLTVPLREACVTNILHIIKSQLTGLGFIGCSLEFGEWVEECGNHIQGSSLGKDTPMTFSIVIFLLAEKQRLKRSIKVKVQYVKILGQSMHELKLHFSNVLDIK